MVIVEVVDVVSSYVVVVVVVGVVVVGVVVVVVGVVVYCLVVELFNTFKVDSIYQAS